MNNLIDLKKIKQARRFKQANMLREIRAILKRLFTEDKRDKIITKKRKKNIKEVKYFFGRRVR